jgi:hypothetical protein
MCGWAIPLAVDSAGNQIRVTNEEWRLHSWMELSMLEAGRALLQLEVVCELLKIRRPRDGLQSYDHKYT